VLDVVDIIAHLIFEAIFLPAKYLSHPRDTWLHGEYLVVMLIIETDLTWLMWTRSYEAHVSDQDIIELGKLIERETLEDTTNSCHTRIWGDLIEWSWSAIWLLLELFFVLEGAIFFAFLSVGIFYGVSPVHIAELIEEELTSIWASTTIFIYDGTTRILYRDEESDDEKYRTQTYERDTRERDIAEALHDASPDTYT
jgi:hypothetical protein